MNRSPVQLTAFSLARKFVGLSEVPGQSSNPTVLAMLQLDASWPSNDEIPWCSAFANAICCLLDLPRSKSLAARSWLKVGTPIDLVNAYPAFDVVILKRGGGHEPGPEEISAPGHVGFYAGRDNDGHILVLGGNQSDRVSIAPFPVERLLGVRGL